MRKALANFDYLVMAKKKEVKLVGAKEYSKIEATYIFHIK